VNFETLLISLFVLVDDWWRENHRDAPRGPGRPPLLAPSEVLTLAILAQWPRFRSERDFFRFADVYLRPYFPNLLSHGQLNRRIRALEPEMQAFQRNLAATHCDGSEVYHVLDTTLIPTIVRVRACRRGLFAGQATFGRCVSRTEWVYGFKVALSVSPEGVVSSFGLAPANSDERPIGEFLVAYDGHDAFLADKGFSSVAWEQRWLERYCALVAATPAKGRQTSMAGVGSSMGSREKTAHRGGDLATQGLFRSRASPGQDTRRPAGPSGGQGSRLHLWPSAQHPTRSPTTPLRLTLDLNNSTADVLESLHPNFRESAF
jgi:hypothetical protein